MKTLIRDSLPSPVRCACNDGFDMVTAPAKDTNEYRITVEENEKNPTLYNKA